MTTTGEGETGFLAALACSPDGVAIGQRGKLVFVNQALVRLLGWSRPEDLVGKAAVDCLAPASRGLVGRVARGQGHDLEALAHPHTVRWLNRDGHEVELEAVAMPLEFQGAPAVLLMLRDLRERRHAEDALRRSEASFRTLIERSPDAVAVHRGGRVVYVNPAAVAWMGYGSAAEMQGLVALELMHPEERDAVRARVVAMVETGVPAPPREERFLRKDGSVVVGEVLALALEFDAQPSVVVLARDLTARRELALKRAQMDRLVAVGTLAAGVGHEINNPLAFITTNLGLLEEGLQGLLQQPGQDKDALGEMAVLLQEAREGTARVGKIVRDLQTFARAEEERVETVDLARVLDACLAMVGNEIRHRARLVREYAPSPPVRANGAQLGQVFTNLLINAAHAIPVGHADAHEIRVRLLAAGSRAVVEVRDSGRGIPAADLPRIFDPFFSTQRAGQGLGLGLPVSRGVVQALGGSLEVDSAVGRGTTVRVVLPGLELPRAVPPPPVPSDPDRRSRVLVVDDEPLVGSSLRRLLGKEHEVVVVDSGRAALDALRADGRYDVILCDLMMPELTGMDVHAELAEHHPDLAAAMVFLTGGAFTVRAREFLDQVPNPRLEKPFDGQEVRALVRQVAARPQFTRAAAGQTWPPG